MYLSPGAGILLRCRSGVLSRRSRERERDLDLRLLLRLLGLSLLSDLLFLIRGGALVAGRSGVEGGIVPLCLDLGWSFGAVIFLLFWVFLTRCCFPRARVDFTPPIFGAGFRGGGAINAPVRVRAEETRLFPTGSLELSGANLANAACTRFDTWAIEGRSEGRAAHSHSASASHAR